MRVTDRQALRLQIMSHEGSGPMRHGRHFPYKCPADKWTIGYGRNLEDVGISADEARDLLDHDIQECLKDLGSFAWWEGLDPVRQRALCDMRFQLGSVGFRGFTRMVFALEQGQFDDAAAHARDSKWARQDSPARAATIAAMIETGTEA